MSSFVRVLVSILLATPIAVFAQDAVLVRIQTSEGAIEAVVDSVHAPRTAANFLRYVDQHFYDEGTFHRTVTHDNQPNATVKIDVVQATIRFSRRDLAFPPIDLESTTTTGLRHTVGTLSMARAEPNTATFDFFICLKDEPALNFGGERNPDGQGFAAFGHVTKGMDVVRKIHESKAEGQKLTPPITITSIRRISPTT